MSEDQPCICGGPVYRVSVTCLTLPGEMAVDVPRVTLCRRKGEIESQES